MKYIITANFGEYENYIPNYHFKGWKHIYFTDKPIEIPGWEVRVIDFELKIFRKIKTCPHLFIKGLKESWWIDANIEPCKLDEFDADFVIMEHPLRDNVIDELNACIEMRRDDEAIMRRQVDQYTKDGFSCACLVASGMIYRRHTQKVKEFGEFWWNEIKNGSVRDQLSFNYSCWKLGFEYKTMPYLNHAEKFKHKKKELIVITGVGRCGTSFMARVFKNLGYDVRGNWYEKRRAGFEDPDVIKINEGILKGEDHRAQIKAISGKVVKDPRFVTSAKTLDQWKIRDLFVIYMQRNPLEIVKSQKNNPEMNTPTYRCFPELITQKETEFFDKLRELKIPHRVFEFPKILDNCENTIKTLEPLTGKTADEIKLAWEKTINDVR